MQNIPKDIWKRIWKKISNLHARAGKAETLLTLFSKSSAFVYFIIFHVNHQIIEIYTQNL
jgi:hypothetical protein